MYKQLATAALFAAGVKAHGHLQSPEPRPLGAAMEAACGQQVYDMMESDENGNIQTMAQTGASQSDYDATACHLWQCRGYQFADANSSTIHSYSAGQVIPVEVVIAAPHTGTANVSIINLAENEVVGDLLAYWSVYASVSTGVAANDTSFSITMPDTLPDACATQGGCAIQWWWNAASIDQTYMSCVDFVWDGTTAAGSSSSSAAASSAVAASSTVAAASSASSSSAAVVVSSAAAATTSVAAAASTTDAATTLATSVAAAAAVTTTSSAVEVAATSSTSAAAAASGSVSSSSSSSCAKKRAARRAAIAARNANN